MVNIIPSVSSPRELCAFLLDDVFAIRTCMASCPDITNKWFTKIAWSSCLQQNLSPHTSQGAFINKYQKKKKKKKKKLQKKKKKKKKK